MFSVAYLLMGGQVQCVEGGFRQGAGVVVVWNDQYRGGKNARRQRGPEAHLLYHIIYNYTIQIKSAHPLELYQHERLTSQESKITYGT